MKFSLCVLLAAHSSVTNAIDTAIQRVSLIRTISFKFNVATRVKSRPGICWNDWSIGRPLLFRVPHRTRWYLRRSGWQLVPRLRFLCWRFTLRCLLQIMPNHVCSNRYYYSWKRASRGRRSLSRRTSTTWGRAGSQGSIPYSRSYPFRRWINSKGRSSHCWKISRDWRALWIVKARQVIRGWLRFHSKPSWTGRARE